MDKKKPVSLISTYHLVFQSLRNQPKLFIPFVCFALVELLFLILVYLAPRQPFNIAFAPPIRTFWGERFLHYPANFLLLPKLASLVRNVLSCVIGAFLTGFAVAMVAEVYFKKTIHVFSALKAAVKKYLSLFTIVFIITVLFFGLVKLASFGLLKYFSSGHATLLFLKPQLWLGPFLMAINLLIVILVQGIFVYAIPFVMIKNVKLFPAIGKSVLLFKELFPQTMAIIVLPLLFYLPVIVLQYNTPFLIDRFFPESVLYICVVAVFVNSFIVDLMITLAATTLFLQRKGEL